MRLSAMGASGVFLFIFFFVGLSVCPCEAQSCAVIKYIDDCGLVGLCDTTPRVIPTEETAITQAAAVALITDRCTDSLEWEPAGDYVVEGQCVYLLCDGINFAQSLYLKITACFDGTWQEEFRSSSTSFSLGPNGYWVVECSDVIGLSQFTATYSSKKKVFVEWTTASEIENAGFNLYRSTSKDGKYIQINSDLIPAQGSATSGASYEYVDDDMRNRKTCWYKLEDIDLKGTSTMHGPVRSSPRFLQKVRH